MIDKPGYWGRRICRIIPALSFAMALSLSGCHEKTHNEYHISIPDTVFADSCAGSNCYYTIYPSVTGNASPNKFEFLYIRENCVGCNFTLSSKRQANIIDDSLYWFKASRLSLYDYKYWINARISGAFGFLQDSVTKIRYWRQSIDSFDGLALPIRIATANTKEVDNCYLGFIESLTPEAVRDSGSGKFIEKSFILNVNAADSTVAWSKKFLLRFSPFGQLSRRLKTMRKCENDSCYDYIDTIVNAKLVELVNKHHGFAESISPREIDSITSFSHERMFYTKYNTLHPELALGWTFYPNGKSKPNKPKATQ